jgi:hypothetical protein
MWGERAPPTAPKSACAVFAASGTGTAQPQTRFT